jgi:hypothetical protein
VNRKNWNNNTSGIYTYIYISLKGLLPGESRASRMINKIK